MAQVPAPFYPERIVELRQVSELVKADEAREMFGVTGRKLAVAVLDSGIRGSHHDFQHRYIAINHTYKPDWWFSRVHRNRREQ